MKKLHYSDTINGNQPFEEERFSCPDNCFYPVYAWVWNDVLDKNEIKKQIDEMLDGGIRCFYVIPEPKEFRPNSMVTRLEPDYLSDEFMKFIKFTADYASEKGMYMWIYDEGGWPSGHAIGKIVEKYPELERKRLFKRTISLKKGETYTDSEGTIAAFIKNKRIFSGHTPEENTEITEFYIEKCGDVLGNGKFADITEKATTEAFIELTHEKYKEYIGEYFGKTVPFMFTDEPKLDMYVFNSDIEKKFIERYNYNIRDFLPIIAKSYGENDEENRIRSDYFSLCGEVFNENYLKTQAKWCEDNGIFFTGHIDNDHKPEYAVNHGYTTHTDTLSNLHVPGIDVIWRQIYRGKDTNDGCKFFPRIAASAAAKRGKNLTMSETFGVYGSGMTCDDIRYVLNYQFVRGINLMNFMTISYGRKDFLTYAERPSFGAEKPGYEGLKTVNEYVARLSYLTTIGKSGTDTLLYLPIKDIHAGGEIRENAIENFTKLGNSLENSGVDFHICDDFTLENAKIENNQLIIGEAHYKIVHIPKNQYMPKHIKQKIEPFSNGISMTCLSTNGFSDIRVTTRILDNGDKLYFFFNESRSKKETTLKFLHTKKIYELNPNNGEIYLLTEGNSLSVSIESGEIKCLLHSNDRFKTDTNPDDLSFAKELTVTDFEISKKSEFIISKDGGIKEFYPENFISASLGAWKKLLGKDFSGDVIYRANLDLDFEPENKVQLSLGKVEYSALVKINGKLCGNAVFEPMELLVDGKNFKKGTNTIEITVSNTAANQFVYTTADKFFEPKEIGPYHERAKEFEKESLGGGLYGPVTLKFSK